jgi:hypothetical protein
VPRRLSMPMKNVPSWRLLSAWVAASTMIQRSHREPCLEMWPRAAAP